MERTHTCGQLQASDIDTTVTLCGWVHKRRDHGGLIFIDLRDRYGITQIVMDPAVSADAHKIGEELRREFVIKATGKVRARPEGMTNPNMSTGDIEVIVSTLEIFARSETPPIEIDDNKVANEEMRLKYRYLDLRRPQMQKYLLLRHTASQAAMKFLHEQEFMYIETPLLMKSTPEGARDYVVPSRVNPGQFYALPQSPQLYKQILMTAGCDRYFQFARCLRDEDLRADRQPEHTQIDLEMSFVRREDVWELIEGLMQAIFKETIGVDIEVPFARIPHNDAMEKYGSDKPDLRFENELVDIADAVNGSDFKVFQSAIDNGGAVKLVRGPQLAEKLSRKEIEGAWTDFAKIHGAKGLAWMKYIDGKLESNIVKFFSDEQQQQIIETAGAENGDVLFFCADKRKIVNTVLGQVRLKVAKETGMLEGKEKEFKFSWICDFPLFEWNEDEKKWDPEHHMFCQPLDEYIPLIESDPGKVVCTQYDLALNGVELSSGSIRVWDPAIQKSIMRVVGISDEEAERKFGFLLESMKYGAPPMGGAGIGFDRLCAMMCGLTDIRELMAFPKNKSAQNPMDGSPSAIDATALKDLHIQLDIEEKKE